MTEKAGQALESPSLNPNQFLATVSLVFNIGSGNVKAFQIRSRLLRDDFEGAANIWWQWRRGGPCQVYSAWPSEAPRDGEGAISKLILGGGRLYFTPRRTGGQRSPRPLPSGTVLSPFRIFGRNSVHCTRGHCPAKS